MYLERIYKRDADGVAARDDNGTYLPEVGVRVIRAGKRQRITPDLVVRGITNGWLVKAESELTLKAVNGSIVYKVTREPGYYCCFCGVGLPQGGKEAQEHVKQKHGEKSPDANNPAGYEKIAYYDCEMVTNDVSLGKSRGKFSKLVSLLRGG